MVRGFETVLFLQSLELSAAHLEAQRSPERQVQAHRPRPPAEVQHPPARRDLLRRRLSVRIEPGEEVGEAALTGLVDGHQEQPLPVGHAQHELLLRRVGTGHELLQRSLVGHRAQPSTRKVWISPRRRLGR